MIVEKAVNIKTKTLLKLPLGTQKINSRFFQGNRFIKKEEKDSEKTKSTDIFSIDVFNSKHYQSFAY